MIREPAKRHAPDWHIRRNVWNRCPRMRPARNESQRVIDGSEELAAKSDPLFLVSLGRLFELSRGFALGAEGKGHRCVRCFDTRSRTSSHGSPVDSLAMARRPRFSISLAHAA